MNSMFFKILSNNEEKMFLNCYKSKSQKVERILMKDTRVAGQSKEWRSATEAGDCRVRKLDDRCREEV